MNERSNLSIDRQFADTYFLDIENRGRGLRS